MTKCDYINLLSAPSKSYPSTTYIQASYGPYIKLYNMYQLIESFYIRNWLFVVIARIYVFSSETTVVKVLKLSEKYCLNNITKTM